MIVEDDGLVALIKIRTLRHIVEKLVSQFITLKYWFRLFLLEYSRGRVWAHWSQKLCHVNLRDLMAILNSSLYEGPFLCFVTPALVLGQSSSRFQ